MRTLQPLVFGGLLMASSLSPATGVAETLAIVGGTVHPVSSQPFVGSVLIEDGRIVEVAAEVSVPAGASTIDATGLHVYPGLMDAMGQIGLIEVGSVSATDDRSEMGMYNPHLVAATAVHPASELIGVARANGITHALVAPRAGGDGVISGQASLMHLDGWTVEEMAIEASAAMVVSFPEVVTRRWDWATFSMKESAFNDAKEEATKKRNEIRDWLDAARHYDRAIKVERPRAGRDLKLAHLARCLDGGMLVLLQANSERDIESAVEFAEQEGLHIAIVGGREAWKVADMLADKEIGVILGAAQALPSEDDDPYDRPFRYAGLLAEAGVKIAFSSGRGAHSARVLPYEAAMAAGYGLSEEAALKALTLWPAEILGVGDRLGSIEPGKIANLIVTDGNPLQIQSTVRHLVIDGRDVSTENHHRSLYEKYRSRPTPQ